MENFSSGSDYQHVYHKGLISRFGEPAYRSWMFDIHIEKNGDDEVEISTESPLRRDKLIQRFKPDLHDEWNRLVSPTKKFSITVRQKQKLSRHAQSVDSQAHGNGAAGDLFGASASSRTARGEGGKAAKEFGGLDQIASPLDARSTFDAFAVDDTNRIAHAAARRVFAEGAPNNLIYIHGPSGVGKTHLLHAIGHEWRAKKRRGRLRLSYSIGPGQWVRGCCLVEFNSVIAQGPFIATPAAN